MKLIFSAIAAAFTLALAGVAHAVHVDPQGVGQALIYPYYTVNQQQQTLLSVTNTSDAAQALSVRFREGYNGRIVMDFWVFLSRRDTWTGVVFNLRDAGFDSDGAGIFSRDLSCSLPQWSSSPYALADGTRYVPFSNASFSGVAADSGPAAITRTREGWVEIIAMADLSPQLLPFYLDPSGPNGAPISCAPMQQVIIDWPGIKPTGALIGAASIINGGQGTLLTARAVALGGFTGRSLVTNTAAAFGGLATVNDGTDDGRATARVFDAAGRSQTLSYGAGFGRPIDAVSAVLMADRLQNEYVVADSIGASSDWVLTMPTKPYYTDPLLIGSTSAALPPFDEVFGQTSAGQSRVLDVVRRLYDREERIEMECNYCCGFPCPSQPPFAFRTAGNVLSFLPNSNWQLSPSAVLGSTLVSNIRPIIGTQGWLDLDLDTTESGHRLPASAEGKVLRGLPVVGFWATNLVNNSVSNGVLANYGFAIPHATSVSCIKASDGSVCD